MFKIPESGTGFILQNSHRSNNIVHLKFLRMDAELLIGVVSLNIIAWVLCDIVEFRRLKRS
jgi:hypothetical protein